MHRTRTGKRLALTARDVVIFTALARYRYLRSTYLHAFAGGASQTRFKERLGDLFHEGFLDRPARQWDFADARFAPVVYELAEPAKRVLAGQGIGFGEQRTFLGNGPHPQFLHSLMICECLASIELATLGASDLRFIAWPEIRARLPEQTKSSPMPYRMLISSLGEAVIPDGIFGLEYRSDAKRSYRFFALEADRGTMPVARSDRKQTSYLAKLSGYRTLLAMGMHKCHLGLPNLLVLTVTLSDRRMDEIIGGFEGGRLCAAFLFKAVSPCRLRLPLPELVTLPWERKDIARLCIAASLDA
jgi:hypothetical protein